MDDGGGGGGGRDLGGKEGILGRIWGYEGLGLVRNEGTEFIDLDGVFLVICGRFGGVMQLYIDGFGDKGAGFQFYGVALLEYVFVLE